MSSSIPTVDLPNGRSIPIIGLGTFMAKDEVGRRALDTALECGYRHVDTAALYANENALGDVLHKWLSNGRINRDELFITTKLPMLANRAAEVSRFLDMSLKKLQLSYVDLYLIHNPVGFKGKHDEDWLPVDDEGYTALNLETDLESLYKAMEEQVDCGKAKAIGISNFNSKQIERIMKVCRIKPANLQIELHAYHQQKELRDICKKHGITVCAYGPIGSPHMGNKLKGEPELLEHPVVKEMANRLKRTPAQILLRFLIQLRIIVIPKSSNPERIKQNIQVFDFELNPSDMSALDSLDKAGKGRTFIFEDICKGISRHPEYPFNIPY